MQENSQDRSQDHGQADAQPGLLNAEGGHWRQAGMVLLDGATALSVTTSRFYDSGGCAVSLKLNDGAAMDMCLRLDLYQARALLRVLGQAVQCAEDVERAVATYTAQAAALAQGAQP